MSVPAFTACPRGFVTAHPLPDGRFLIEGWVLTLQPIDGGEPRHELAYHWIATNQQDAATTVNEFAGYLTAPLAA